VIDGLLANILEVPLIIVSLGSLSVFRGLGLLLSNARHAARTSIFEIFAGNLLGPPTTRLGTRRYNPIRRVLHSTTSANRN
jgi:ribose/xylose/arabinose/galactoside ABC-type transport system permease subunit